jgi:Tfp pilus assembly protein PilF
MKLKQNLELAEKYFRSNDYHKAKEILIQVLQKDCNNTKANELLAYIYGNTGNTAISNQYLIKACKDKQASAEALYFFGISYVNTGNYIEAKKNFLKAIAKEPFFFEGLHALGIVCQRLEEYSQALEYYKKATKIKKDSFELFYNLGCLYLKMNQYQKAINQFEKTIQINKRFGEAFHSKAAAHRELNQYEEALENFDQAIKLNQHDYDSICNKSVIQLVMGNYIEGWEAYQYRWKQIPEERYRYKKIKELNDLSELKEKSILVWWEQGFGDTIQFSRYINELIKLTPNVTFEVQKELLPLMKEQFNCKVIDTNEKSKNFDFQVPLLKLPYLFKTTIETVPLIKNYIKSNPLKSDDWRKKLKLSNSKKNIGIAIAGSAIHPNDKNRSISIEFITPLMEISNLYLIQKTLNENDKNFLEKYRKINYLGNQIIDFSDTAAIIENMDLIISVDTSLIHLAGSMGKISYLMLPWVPEWRWLQLKKETPWYKTIQIFRQPKANDWKTVIKEIRKKILETEN